MDGFRSSFLVFMVLVLHTLIGCQRDSLRLEGELSNVADDVAYLSVLDTALRMTIVDSAEITDGNFVFDGGVCLPSPECVVLTIGSQNMVLFVGNECVRLRGNMLMQEDIEVCGSLSNDSLLHFMANIPGVDRMVRLEAEYATAKRDTAKREVVLENIRSRLAFAGGSLELSAREGGGTRVRVRIPQLYS